jgi:hypothetical protein
MMRRWPAPPASSAPTCGLGACGPELSVWQRQSQTELEPSAIIMGHRVETGGTVIARATDRPLQSSCVGRQSLSSCPTAARATGFLFPGDFRSPSAYPSPGMRGDRRRSALASRAG